MKTPGNNAPVFALDEITTWHDLEDAMAASASYQAAKLGRNISLMFFAPLTEPSNPDAWEPMGTMPLNLLVVSIARAMDVTVLRAMAQAETALGGTRGIGGKEDVSIDFETDAVAEVYGQMEAAGLRFHTHTKEGEDDPSFFFMRGGAAVRAFDRALRDVTRRSA